jgi:hypothetical protein
MLLGHWKQDISERAIILALQRENHAQSRDVVMKEHPVTLCLHTVN